MKLIEHNRSRVKMTTMMQMALHQSTKKKANPQKPPKSKKLLNQKMKQTNLVKIIKKKKSRKYPIREVLKLKRTKDRNSKGPINRRSVQKMLMGNLQRAVQMKPEQQMMRLALRIPMLNQAQK